MSRNITLYNFHIIGFSSLASLYNNKLLLQHRQVRVKYTKYNPPLQIIKIGTKNKLSKGTVKHYWTELTASFQSSLTAHYTLLYFAIFTILKLGHHGNKSIIFCQDLDLRNLANFLKPTPRWGQTLWCGCVEENSTKYQSKKFNSVTRKGVKGAERAANFEDLLFSTHSPN